MQNDPNNPISDVSSPSPLNTSNTIQKTVQDSGAALAAQAAMGHPTNQRSIAPALRIQPGLDEASPVMNETLSVIDEHITDMNTPRSSLLADDLRVSDRSGSEYSSHLDHRLSYIAGEETDEEEQQDRYTRADVMKWSPGQTASHLRGLGVEARHCEVFREQEISGEVLLAMDQSAVFMKEFDLGVVGRRLRTWHKIKSWQDELKSREDRRKDGANKLQTYSSAEELQERQVLPGMSIPRAISFVDGSDAIQSHSPRLPMRSMQSSPSPQIFHGDLLSTPPPSFTPQPTPDSPNRPSAALVRDLNHSRRHSTNDFTTKARTAPIRNNNTTPTRTMTSPQKSPHKKVPSLDRNWTMQGSSAAAATAPATSATKTKIMPLGGDGTVDSQTDADRGYMSGGDLDSRKARKVLKKRDPGSASHSRQSSYLDEQRGTTSTSRRHSRLPSVDSIRDTMAALKAPASKLYHANSLKGRQRDEAAAVARASSATNLAGTNLLTSPVVTRLEYDEKPTASKDRSSKKAKADQHPSNMPRSITSPLTSTSSDNSQLGLRAASDSVTPAEKSVMTSPSSINSSNKESAFQSPRTGSTTPSAASQSLDLESTDASSKGTATVQSTISPTVGTVRKKPKKATSAYIRGLEQKTPQEQMLGCDYSGWMKKKSSNLMTTWKPRLFILRGRRLSYYYSENDDCEKGLIDISYHRVLAADKDTMTSLHATITRTRSSPVSPTNAQTLTTASADAAAIAKDSNSTLPKSDIDNVFIFKLVPPRTGLSRAVHFTKPTVHYFAVDNVVQGRLWMAALMKAVIDRDESKPITTSYAHKTISLSKARQLKHRPPALMGLDDRLEGVEEAPKSDQTGLNIVGLDMNGSAKRAESLGIEQGEEDAAVPNGSVVHGEGSPE